MPFTAPAPPHATLTHTHEVLEIHSADTAGLPGLAALLQDCVHQGASLGFLAPLSLTEAQRYWQGLDAELGQGRGRGLRLWVARDGQGQITGSVQLQLSGQPNAAHRGEVQKLMVSPSARRQGLGRALLQTAEAAALAQHRHLLVLDTESGSTAEGLYRAEGWQAAGQIPDFAASPNGQLRATSIYFKQLAR